MSAADFNLHTSAQGTKMEGFSTDAYFSEGKPALPYVSSRNYLADMQNQIQALEAREDEFVRGLGFDDINDFYTTIRQIFKDNSNDREALERFSASNLRQIFHQMKKTANEFLFF